MKPMILVVTLVLPASFANANTMSVLDARVMTLKQWNPKPGTSGIGSGVKSKKVPVAPPADSPSNPRDHLTR
jgi:hypothetical protein